MPEISIIMPCFNSAKTVRNAINSIQHQTFADWELIVVDDGSTDATADILAEISNNDSRLHIIRQNHAGIVPALLEALNVASAPYIARMDADDTSLTHRLEKQLTFLQQHPHIGLLSCLVKYGGDPVEQCGYKQHVDWINSVVSTEDLIHNRFIESPFAHPSIMFRANLLKQYGTYRNGPFPEDYELWLRWMDQGVVPAKIPEPLLIWNDPPHRLSRTDDRYSVDAFYKIKAEYLAKELVRTHGNRPSVWIWGAGKTSVKRSDYLKVHGARIVGYIDVDPNKIGNKRNNLPILSAFDLPIDQNKTILFYVGSRGAREKTINYLKKINCCKVGENFLFVS